MTVWNGMTLYDLKMPFGVPQNVCQFSVAIFKINPISWLDISLMKPLKNVQNVLCAEPLEKGSCWAESGAVRHSSSGPQTVINRALSAWSHDTSRGTEVAKVCSSCTKSLSHRDTSCHAFARGGKKRQLESHTEGLSHQSEHRESGLKWTSMPSHSLFNIIIHL